MELFSILHVTSLIINGILLCYSGSIAKRKNRLNLGFFLASGGMMLISAFVPIMSIVSTGMLLGAIIISKNK